MYACACVCVSLSVEKREGDLLTVLTVEGQ